MVNKNAPPSHNPANDDSLTGLLRQVMGKFLQNTDDMLPAIVIAYDRVTNYATVQPQIMVVSTNNDKIARAQVAKVPVFQIGGGGFIMNYNMKPGDLGWIKANDRDISLFTQASFTQSAPNTKRMHSFEDAVFFPHVMKNYTIAADDLENGNAVIQNLAGTVRISLWEDKIKITSPTEIILDAPLTVITGLLDSGGDSAGTAHFRGRVQVDQDIHADLDIVANTVSLEHHIHSASGGSGNGGPPVP